jgi:5S rRNA maturation endonuclease (ribonuclease M5)
MNRTNQIDVAVLKQQAAGRWLEILSALGGCPAELLDGKNHPCPKCGGKDRFRFTNLDGNGSCYCNQCGKGIGDGIAALMWLCGWDFNGAVAELAKYLGFGQATAAVHSNGNGNRKIVATYDYKDEHGVLLYQVVRYEPKDFRQRRPKVGGGWQYSVKGTRLVPYRLPDLMATPPSRGVLVVEGEKDADRVASMGIVATTCAMGAGKWRPEYNEYFRGRSVYIIPDNDNPGREHAQQVAQAIHGIAKNIKVVELQDVPEKGDLSDWLDGSGTKDKLVELVKAAPEWKPTPAGKRPKPATEPKKLELPPYVPFPTDVLPGAVAAFIHQGAAAIDCDESYIALPLLAALAAAVGNTRRIKLKRDWKEPCILWAVIVGESGTRKSPALDCALHALREIQNAAFREYKEAIEQYRAYKVTFDADILEWRKKGRKNSEPPPEEPVEPVPVRYIVNDVTAEALAVLLEQQPRGLLVAHDELSGWVNSFDAYKACHGKDAADWLSMHRAGVVTKDRKTGRRLIHVPRAAVSITGGIQPKTLKSALAGRYEAPEGAAKMEKPNREHFDNGLAARLLFAFPPPKAKPWSENSISDSTQAAMEEVFHRLLSLDFDPDKEEPTPIDLPHTAAGKAAWVRFYNQHAREQVDLHGDLAAAWSKVEGYAARFALLVHLVRSVCDESTLIDHNAVDEYSVGSGVTLARWFADEAARVYAVIGGDTESPEAREQRELVRIMQYYGGKITPRQLMQTSRKYRSSAEEAAAALGRLVSAGKANVWTDDHGGGRGRPTLVFTLIDAGNGNTNTDNPEETAIVLPLPPPKESENEVVEWTG